MQHAAFPALPNSLAVHTVRAKTPDPSLRRSVFAPRAGSHLTMTKDLEMTDVTVEKDANKQEKEKTKDKPKVKPVDPVEQLASGMLPLLLNPLLSAMRQ